MPTRMQGSLRIEEKSFNWREYRRRTASGWRDLTASVSAAGIPVQNAPAIAVFGPAPSAYEAYVFDVGEYVYLQPFHVDHDVKVGGQALAHVHWSTNGTSTNRVTWEFQIMRALGHNQGNFAAPITRTVAQAAAGTAWRHMIAEVDLSGALTLTEPDELILVVLKRIANVTGAANADSVYGLTVDFHYEADRYSTPNRSPNFYEQ